MLLLLRISAALVLITILLCMVFPQSELGQQTAGIDGAYRFVSETTKLRKSKIRTIYRKPPDWSGFFFFESGYFSVSLMDQTREGDWFTKFPKNIREVGFESFAGKYEFSGAALILRPEIKLHPFYDRLTRTFDVKLEGNILTLTEKLRPYTEDLRDGERVVVLTRIKSGAK